MADSVKRPLEQVALGVRAAEVLEHGADGQQLGRRRRRSAPRCRRAPRATPEADLRGHGPIRPRLRRRVSDVALEPLDHLPGVVGPAGAAERNHRVEVVEDVPRLVDDLAFPRLGELGVAVAGVDPVEVSRHSSALASSISSETPAESSLCTSAS